MKIKHLFICFISTTYFLLLFYTPQAEEIILPDISGEWVSLAENGERTTAKINLLQAGRDISGNFTDEQDGRVLVDARLIGYVDKQGNVIFDVYFGKVTSTNRLKLSPDKNTLDGTFTNTIGNEGKVSFAR